MRKTGMLVGSLVLLFSAGCKKQAPQAAATGGAKPAPPAASTVPSPAKAIERAMQAEKLFVTWCGGCHGDRGRGNGPASEVLNPKPRDLVADKFKIRSTPTGTPPTRKDLFDTITRGLPGTAMPAFQFLTDEERSALVDHVQALAGLEGKPDPKPIDLGAEPARTAEAIARGKGVYSRLKCGECHGETGRGDGPASRTLTDDRGRPIPARDYSKGQYLGGDSPAALHMRFVSGLDGTGMPSFAESMSKAEGWDLAHYVLSLRTPPPPPPGNPVAWGRRVVEERQCFACHTIEGRGADVGPNLDVSAVKLRSDWVKGFLAKPLAHGKIYPYTPYRMPDLKLSAQEIDGLVALFDEIARKAPPPAVVKVDESKVGHGQLLYFLKCTECHNMGSVIPTPDAKRQGPDLINVSQRVHLRWIPSWVNNPRQVNPAARMVDTNLKEDEIAAVTAFIWKTSTQAGAKK